MRNPYNLIWSNAILNFWKHNPNNNNWKLVTFSFITWMQAFNLWVIAIWIKFFEIFEIPTLEIDIFAGDMIDGFLSFALVFALPFVPINYLLIFYKSRYKKLVKKYNQTTPNYAFQYILISSLGALFTAFLYGSLT